MSLHHVVATKLNELQIPDYLMTNFESFDTDQEIHLEWASVAHIAFTSTSILISMPLFMPSPLFIQAFQLQIMVKSWTTYRPNRAFFSLCAQSLPANLPDKCKIIKTKVKLEIGKKKFIFLASLLYY